MDEKKIIQAGRIASQAKKYAKELIKRNMPLLEIAEKIEGKIIELGGKPAFPINLSINEIAAHYTPSHDDKTLATGLLKVDLGVQVDGYLADSAFSLDLENSNENKILITSAELALKNAINSFKEGESTSKIGKIISDTITSNKKLAPIINLSGHSMGKYELHAGINIPNIDDEKNLILESGLYAIEPFTTDGSGKVYDGKPSGIYVLIEGKNTRSQISREILNYIIEEYSTLPFCSRWLIKQFGTKALFGLKQLEEQGILHQFPQLVEISKSKVAQAEETVLINKKEKIVTTE